MSSRGSADQRINRLERRMNGLKQSMNELQEENEDLRQQLAVVHAYNAYMEDRVADLHEKLESYRETFRQVHVNEDMLEDLDLRMQSKVGVSAFEILEERVKQIRSQVNFLADYVDVEQRELEEQAEDMIEQRTE